MNVDGDRLRDLTLELVEVESPTGDTAEVAPRLIPAPTAAWRTSSSSPHG